MKYNGHIFGYGILIIIILILLNMVLAPGGGVKAGDSPSSESWTVYGTKSCGWTRKQLSLMDSKDVSYKFVDCDNGGDCDGMSAFPTLLDPSGNKTVGYKEDF
jgi:hypothetical protein